MANIGKFGIIDTLVDGKVIFKWTGDLDKQLFFDISNRTDIDTEWEEEWKEEFVRLYETLYIKVSKGLFVEVEVLDTKSVKIIASESPLVDLIISSNKSHKVKLYSLPYNPV